MGPYLFWKFLYQQHNICHIETVLLTLIWREAVNLFYISSLKALRGLLQFYKWAISSFSSSGPKVWSHLTPLFLLCSSHNSKAHWLFLLNYSRIQPLLTTSATTTLVLAAISCLDFYNRCLLGISVFSLAPILCFPQNSQSDPFKYISHFSPKMLQWLPISLIIKSRVFTM